MSIYKIALIGVIASILAITLKEQSPVFTIILSLMTGIVMILYILKPVEYIISELKMIFEYTEIPLSYMEILVKVLAISYIALFSEELCSDFGQKNVSEKIKLGGKILIIFYSLPLITDLINNILSIL